jgi:lipoate-protein ligase A
MIIVDSLKVIPFGAYPPGFNMDLDSRLLALCEEDPRTAFLRFYTWSPPALSIGYLDKEEAVDAARAAEAGVEIVRRPTGGRVVLHDQDLTYTMVVPRQGPNSEAIYVWISGCIVAGLSALGAAVELAGSARTRSAVPGSPCFLSAARHEIVYSGRKIVGSAQRLGRRAVLQHGTIPVGRGYLGVVAFLACPDSEKEAMRREMLSESACLDDVLGSPGEASSIAAALEKAFAARLGVDAVSVAPETACPTQSGPSPGGVQP